MSDALEPLILDLLEWLAPEPRSLTDVMDTWRTSCPHLPVWEESFDRGLVDRRSVSGAGTFVSLSSLGWAMLRVHRPQCESLSEERCIEDR